MIRVYKLLLVVCLAAAVTFGQQGGAILKGIVKDPSGAAVPGATVTAVMQGSQPKRTTTDDGGHFQLIVPAGTYSIRTTAPGFSVDLVSDLALKTGPNDALEISLLLATEKQQVTVEDTAKVDMDPSNNVGQLVLKGEDLESLSDNPDDLASDLAALAGPSAGPNGGQIFVDGFTGGRLPPKSAIREVRVNSNPFSAEYDKLGFGRIEILTKPGTDKFHGQAFFNFGDGIFNSRNPFAKTRPDYQQKFFGGNMSGALGKKASFFIDAERRAQDETSVINALTLDSALNVTPYTGTVLNPMTRTTVSPRVDFTINEKNTASIRYTYGKNDQINQGLNEFTLPTRAFNSYGNEHVVQATETAVLSANAINEARFQYFGRRNNQNGDNSTPAVNVLESFSGGGATVGMAYGNEDRYEVSNTTSITHGKHMTKFGGRLRAVNQTDYSTQGYNGAFTFTTLDAYRLTLLGLQQGLTMQQIRASGGGPSQFTLTAGNPLANVKQWDSSLFIQDDWRLKPNFTLSLGGRYELQNNISDKSNFAPRIGIAWGVGGRQPKTVIRGGVGMFYDRVSEDLTLSALRLNGVNQQQFIVPFPSFYPTVPSVATLTSNLAPTAIRVVDSNIHAPYIMQSALGVERQLPKNITVSVNWTHSRGVHVLRSRNINAPLAGTYSLLNPLSAVYPLGAPGNTYLYESTGFFNQDQLMTNINARVNPKLSLFGFYVYGKARSDADGVGSFPANQYDVADEYGRAGFDVRHRAFIGGSVSAPFALRFSPFIVANTGNPFNITTGRDNNGDSIFNDRPAFATDMSRPSVVRTQWGIFDTNPIAGQTIIPRNYGNGPGQFNVNLRLSRTWGFGESTSTPARSEMGGGMRGPMGGGPGGGGMRGGPGGGGMGGGMRGGGGPGGMMFGEGGNHKYNLTLSVSARNLFNHVNPAAPVGNLSSPLFGTSNALASSFFSSATANRRLEFQLRFSF